MVCPCCYGPSIEEGGGSRREDGVFLWCSVSGFLVPLLLSRGDKTTRRLTSLPTTTLTFGEEDGDLLLRTPYIKRSAEECGPRLYKMLDSELHDIDMLLASHKTRDPEADQEELLLHPNLAGRLRGGCE
ncbi:hypothetical protein Bbelb_278330 [Branchiostoma belcheri]|nr:hypothetical protein Bbelb_278330 [Branchiostoma belcheri]